MMDERSLLIKEFENDIKVVNYMLPRFKPKDLSIWNNRIFRRAEEIDRLSEIDFDTTYKEKYLQYEQDIKSQIITKLRNPEIRYPRGVRELWEKTIAEMNG